MKHRLKMAARELYARLLFHTGLHVVVNRIAPRRLVILAGHCVAPESGSWPGAEHLPADMITSAGTLRTLLQWFAQRYAVVTVGQGVAALDQGSLERSLVAFSFDDGYRDNHAVLLPLLRQTATTATVYLESRPLDERRVSWSHKLFWLLGRMSLTDFVEAYGRHAPDDPSFLLSNQMLAEGRTERPAYQVKRRLKYEGDPDVRDAAVDAVFCEQGGDETALCEALYMSWDEARELHAAGVELGGHTIGHPILSRLDAQEQEREIAGGAAALRRELSGELASFAYPWGRRWDFDEPSRAAVSAAGFHSAVTMHAGANLPRSDRLALKRLAIDDDARLHLLVAEACGGFELLRRLGVDLSE